MRENTRADRAGQDGPAEISLRTSKITPVSPALTPQRAGGAGTGLLRSPEPGPAGRGRRCPAGRAGGTARTKGSSFRLLPNSGTSAVEQGETKHLFKGVVGKRGNQTSRSERGRLPF